MAGRFSSGEVMARPGVYFRETSTGGAELAGARNGIVAVAFQANWGPLGEIVNLESPADILRAYGDEAVAGSNTSILEKIFLGGASLIKAIRVGTGGTKAAITLKDTTAETAVSVITLTAKYAGTRPLSVTIKDSLSITTKRECIIYAGTMELCKVLFAKGDAGEVDALVAAINASEGCVVTAEKLAAGNGIMAAVTQTAFTTAGASPAITDADYSAAFTVLESSKWNTLCVDSDDTGVHALVASFITRANDAGLMAIAVIGEPTSVAYATRKANAAAFNSQNLVYVLNGFNIGGTDYEGFEAAAVVAGLIAYLPANDSPTHKSIPGAATVVGPLTNTEVVECLQSGAIVFTASAAGAVWIEQGINTLVTLSADQDAGWKKIRRTKTRYELIQRILESAEDVIGSVGNDSNGRSTIISIANGIINSMISEGKLVSGAVEEDPANPAAGDSAWFVISVVDLDSIEKVYITYRFSFTEE